MRRRWVGSVGFVAMATAIVACGGGTGGPATEPKSETARIHRSKCGSCHTRVEPGQRTREQLEAAFPRHRKRVRLTEEQWGEMVDYLAAAPAPSSAPPSTPQ